MNFIGKLLPVDGYYVKLKENLPLDYSKSLTHLYQPLIGMQAIMLYYTLLHEIEMQSKQTIQTHHTLMNYLNLPLDKIYKARLKLEGIGLLSTYEHNTEEKNYYLYELNSPFAPNYFFKDAMLSQLLYHHLGDEKYEQLKNHYVLDEEHKNMKNITVSFNDVFQTFEPSKTKVESITNYRQERGPNVEPVDFSWIEHILKQRLIPAKKILTRDNKRIIKQMMTLYDLTSYDIENALLWALTEENVLNVDEFKEACHSLFNSYNAHRPIQLTEKQQSVKEKAYPEQPKTKEEMLIKELETISPQQLLMDLSSGNQASEQDMKVIRDVMTSQGLPAPVMNVLIHYVLLQSNMKLSKAYMEKIASHWSRANLKTAKEAMEFAKKEQSRFQQRNTNKNKNYRRFNKRVSNEVVPDWFKERNAKKVSTSNKDAELKDEKEKEELEMLLKKYSNNNNHN
ncbi:MAG TPA: DnaD domain protein [Candidatus Avamphibacillus sp.]|nr:DnaD domain protein [Candidatus Avamphibacillus sp.]